MKEEVIGELSAYLEAQPLQVHAWDQGVINYFVSHPEVFREFRASEHYQKWNIYHSIRYRNQIERKEKVRFG